MQPWPVPTPSSREPRRSRLSTMRCIAPAILTPTAQMISSFVAATVCLYSKARSWPPQRCPGLPGQPPSLAPSKMPSVVTSTGMACWSWSSALPSVCTSTVPSTEWQRKGTPLLRSEPVRFHLETSTATASTTCWSEAQPVAPGRSMAR